MIKYPMTKKEMYVAIMNLADVAANEEMVEFLQHQIELLDSRKKRPSAKQIKNETIKDTIFQVLFENDKPLNVSELKDDPRLADYSINKISALVTQMTQPTEKHPNSDGRLVRTVIGKVPYFAVFEGNEEIETEQSPPPNSNLTPLTKNVQD